MHCLASQRGLPLPPSRPDLFSLEPLQVLFVGHLLLPQRGLGLPLGLYQLLGQELLVQGHLLFCSYHLLP